MFSELWSDLRYRARAILRRNTVEHELDAELRFHIEHEAEKLERTGLSRGEALRRARLTFGGVDRTKEESRDARGTMLLESLLQDTRYAARGLRAKPAFTLGVVLTLGLGIGANAAMFGIVDRLLFRPPEFLRDADHVHRVYLTWTSNKSERVERNMQFPRYLDLMRSTHSFSSLAAFHTWKAAVGDGDAARERPVTAASAAYFDFFDARPALGRFFTAREDSIPTGSPVVVLGNAYWQSEFGGQVDALGKQLRVGHTLYTIIGVAPKGFAGMSDQGVPALFVPISAFAWDMRGNDYSKAYHWSWLEVIARRKPDVSVAAAVADLGAAHQRSWIAQDPVRGPQMVASSRPRAELGPAQLGRGPQAGLEAKVVMWVTGVAIIVLLIACANVANLLLARAITRRREIALRLALGVSRARLMRQLLTESLLLAAFGGVVGLVTAHWGGAVLAATFLPSDFSTTVLTDKRTLVAALVATLGAAVLTGFAPAVHAVRSDLGQALNAGGRDAGARRSRTRTLLLIAQATLSVMLLVGAGLFVRSLRNVRAMRLGYDVDPIVVVARSMRGVQQTDAQRMALEQRMVDEARVTPGVLSATQAASVPFWANEGRPLFVSGIDTVSKLGRFLLQAGNADYFQTLGTRVERGRSFDAHDRADAPRVIVVSEGMAAALWAAQNPLGKCVRIGADTAPCSTVIGVAEDRRVRSLAEEREYAYYVPIAQYAEPTGMLLVRVVGDATEHAELIRRQLQRLMPGPAYVTAVPLRNMVDPTMQSWRFGAAMFVAFGALALALAGIGLYSMIAYGVAQRRQELGIRIALGASRANVVRLVVRDGLRLVIVGVIAGGAISLWAGKWVATLLFRESPSDPAVYIGVATVLIGVSLVATAMPAIAASRVDPNVALRAD